MPGNRLPRGRTSPTGKPGNRAPTTLVTVQQSLGASDAAAKVEAASDNAGVAQVAASIPPDLTAAVDTLNTTAADLESRVAALESP